MGDKNIQIMTMNDVRELEEDELEKLYIWVDEIPLSRPKKNVTRDFSDGVLAAEIVKHYSSKIVELHNYTAASAAQKKVSNWQLLNRKVLGRIGLEVGPDMIRGITQCRPGVVECFLMVLRDAIDLYLAARLGQKQQQQQQQYYGQEPTGYSDRTEVDQHSLPNGYRGYMSQEDYYPSGKLNVPRGVDPHKLHEVNHQLKAGGRAAKGKQKVDMVPRAALEEKERELDARQQTIEILQAKVDRLEHLLSLKDIRIEDLSSRVEGLELSAPGKPAPAARRGKVGGSYAKR